MKALTLHQPWASLVALGVKTIETRSWSTDYRGPLAIHAGAKQEHHGKFFMLARIARSARQITAEAEREFRALTVPFGAVVSTCELVDVVPIHEQACSCTPCEGLYLLRAVGGLGREVLGLYRPDGKAICYVNGNEAEHPWIAALERPHDDPVTEQLPYGDYRCGRFAYLLADVEPLDPPVPARGRQRIWNWSTV